MCPLTFQDAGLKCSLHRFVRGLKSGAILNKFSRSVKLSVRGINLNYIYIYNLLLLFLLERHLLWRSRYSVVNSAGYVDYKYVDFK